MRRAKRKWGGYSFMIKEDGVSFGSQKERDAYHGREVTKVTVTHGKPKLIERVSSTIPLFTDRINYLISIGKVKYYKSLTDFKNRGDMKTNYEQKPIKFQSHDAELENIALEFSQVKRRYFATRVKIVNETPDMFSYGRIGEIFRVSFGWRDDETHWHVRVSQGKDNPLFFREHCMYGIDYFRMIKSDAEFYDKIEITKYKTLNY